MSREQRKPQHLADAGDAPDMASGWELSCAVSAGQCVRSGRLCRAHSHARSGSSGTQMEALKVWVQPSAGLTWRRCRARLDAETVCWGRTFRGRADLQWWRIRWIRWGLDSHVTCGTWQPRSPIRVVRSAPSSAPASSDPDPDHHLSWAPQAANRLAGYIAYIAQAKV